MRAKTGGILIAGCCGVLAGVVAPAYEASRGPTELIYWDPQKAYPGYAFIRTRLSGVTGVYLIDMAGQVVNYWPEFTDAYLLEDGTMLGAKQDHYVNPPHAGYTAAMPGSEDSQNRVTRLFSGQIVWMYHTSDGFNSHHGSATQRLPNGNTMAQLARVGRLLEITPAGEIVWEYVNPVTNAGIVKTLVTSEHENVFGGWSPLRYGVDFPGLAGKDLSPKGPVTAFHGNGIPGEGSEGALAEEEEAY